MPNTADSAAPEKFRALETLDRDETRGPAVERPAADVDGDTRMAESPVLKQKTLRRRPHPGPPMEDD